MERDWQTDEDSIEAKLSEFIGLQRRWMSFASMCLGGGVGLAYTGLRPRFGDWPTILSWLVPSYEAEQAVILVAFGCVAVAALTAFAVNAYRDRLGALKDSGRVPITKFSANMGLKWVFVLVALNELTGLVISIIW